MRGLDAFQIISLLKVFLTSENYFTQISHDLEILDKQMCWGHFSPFFKGPLTKNGIFSPKIGIKIWITVSSR